MNAFPSGERQQRVVILIPIYNESGNIAALVREIDTVVAGLPAYDFRMLFVDDGSSDGSAAILEAMAARDSRIGLIELSRNFGKELALALQPVLEGEGEGEAEGE